MGGAAAHGGNDWTPAIMILTHSAELSQLLKIEYAGAGSNGVPARYYQDDGYMQFVDHLKDDPTNNLIFGSTRYSDDSIPNKEMGFFKIVNQNSDGTFDIGSDDISLLARHSWHSGLHVIGLSEY